MIPLSSVDLGERELAYTRDALETGWISSTGTYVDRFESALAKRLERRAAVSTCSGTAALELVLRGLGIGPGDEVIVPALTFAAPASAVVNVGATPRFVDVTRETWTIDPIEVERARTRRTRLVIAVDLLGHPCDYDSLAAIGIPILEDAAQAHGAGYRARPVGSFGVASILSFHANKTITTGEGGAALTDDDDLAARMRLLNGHGMTRERPYHHPVAGMNQRMTNLGAAVGLAQVERWDELVAARRAVSASYDAAFAGLEIDRRPVAKWASESTWLHTITSSRRDALVSACRAAGVDARGIWPLVPHQPAFETEGVWPNAEHASARALWLPTSSVMRDDDIGRVIDAVRQGISRG